MDKENRGIDKGMVYRLISECNRRLPSNKRIKYSFTSDGSINMILNGRMYIAIPLEDAYDKLKTSMKSRPDIQRGKGYIERKMSVNAQAAHDNGLKPKSYFTNNVLQELGFHYSVSFFHWLIKSHYLLPTERHHTSASKNFTNFYSPESICRLVSTYNLDLLYNLYLGKITKDDAEKIRGIKYTKIRIPKSLLDSQGGVADMDCILCDNTLFFTPKLCFSAKDPRIQILETHEECPADFKNAHTKGLINNLLKRKAHSFDKYIKR